MLNWRECEPHNLDNRRGLTSDVSNFAQRIEISIAIKSYLYTSNVTPSWIRDSSWTFATILVPSGIGKVLVCETRRLIPCAFSHCSSSFLRFSLCSRHLCSLTSFLSFPVSCAALSKSVRLVKPVSSHRLYIPVLTRVIVTAYLYMNQIKARIQVLKAIIKMGMIIPKDMGTIHSEIWWVYTAWKQRDLHMYLNCWLSLMLPCPNSMAFMPKILAIKDKGS